MGWIWLQINVKGVSFSDGLIVLSVISEEKACQGGMLLSRGKCCYLYEKGKHKSEVLHNIVAIHSHITYESYL